MTSNNRTKTLARRLQAATGTPYATCHQQIEAWNTASDDLWDEAAYQVADAELLPLTRQIAADISADTLRVKFTDLGHGATAIFVSLPDATRTESDEPTTRLQIDVFEGYFGYQRWVNDSLHVMGNFLHDDGTEITPTSMLRDPAAALDRLRTGITWLVTGFADQPDRYDDTGRPNTISDPIFE